MTQSVIRASTVARFVYVVLVVLTTLTIGASCLGLLSQAVRTARNEDWIRNVNVVIIGGTYILIVRKELSDAFL